MESTDFILVLETKECNIIYHKNTKSFNVTNINNFMFSKSLTNYNNKIKNLSKRQKLKIIRPIKLELTDGYDMRKSSELYRGFYLDDCKTLLDSYYNKYDYSYNDFIKYIKKAFIEKIADYNANEIKKLDHLYNLHNDMLKKNTAVISKSNLVIVKDFLTALYNCAYEYNKLLIQFGKDYNINIINHIFNVKQLKSHLENVLGLNLTISNNSLDLHELDILAKKFSKIIVDIPNINKKLDIYYTKFRRFDVDIHHNCNSYDKFIINNKDKWHHLSKLISGLNNNIKHFNPIIANDMRKIQKFQDEVSLDYDLYDSEYYNFIECKKTIETLIKEKINIDINHKLYYIT